jgi:SsrA-binding protein
VKGLLKSVQTKGLTIVPLKLFTNEKDWQTKVDFKERKPTTNAIPKEQDTKRDLDRIKKSFKLKKNELNFLFVKKNKFVKTI